MKVVDRSANDDSPEALAAAALNWQLLANDWCHCKNFSPTDADIAYYRDPESGCHGWMCCQCFGIVQTG